MDFSTSVFVCPLHAVRPYPRFSALHAACCFTRPQDLTRASALYTQLALLYPASGPYPRFSALHAACCFTRPQALKPFERCEATLERCVAALNS